MAATKQIGSVDAFLQAHEVQVETDGVLAEVENKKILLGGRMHHTICHAYDLRRQQKGFLKSFGLPREIRSPAVYKSAEVLEQGHQVSTWLSSSAVSETVELRTAIIDDEHKLVTESGLLMRADGNGKLNYFYGAGLLVPSVELELVDTSIDTVAAIFKAIDGHFDFT